MDADPHSLQIPFGRHMAKADGQFAMILLASVAWARYLAPVGVVSLFVLAGDVNLENVLKLLPFWSDG